MTKNIPHILLLAYLILFTTLAIEPFARDVWFAENLPIVLIVLGLILLYRRGVIFSSTSYFLMSFLIFMHTIGGHYTFEKVPFDWFNQLFGYERNMYDRLAHFTVGFYAFPIAEYLFTRRLVKSTWVLGLFPIFTIFTVAAAYEIIEWIYAALSDPTAGAAFLGSQGDIWDAQKDMLADGLGGILVTLWFLFQNKTRLSELR